MAVGVAFAFWCLPQVFFYGLYTVLGQVLNARGSFGPYMWAPVVNNVVAIVGMVVFVAPVRQRRAPGRTGGPPAPSPCSPAPPPSAWSRRRSILVPVLRRTGFRWRPRPRVPRRRPPLGRAGRRLDLRRRCVVGQLGLLVLSRIANGAGQEAGAAGTGRFVYDTAFLLFMLPHSLVAVSVVTAVFTRMSHAVVAGRFDAVRDDVSLALRTTGRGDRAGDASRSSCWGRTSLAAVRDQHPRHRRGPRLDDDGDGARAGSVQRHVPLPAGVLRLRRRPDAVLACRSLVIALWTAGEHPGRRPAVGGRRRRGHRRSP